MFIEHTMNNKYIYQKLLKAHFDLFIFYRLNTAEMAFLTEYAAVMKPVAMALNVLQGETSVHMGFLLPTLHQLQDKLKRLQASCKMCGCLIDSLQRGITKRFGDIMQEPELIAAAILLPKFRTSWTTDDNIIKAGKCTCESIQV